MSNYDLNQPFDIGMGENVYYSTPSDIYSDEADAPKHLWQFREQARISVGIYTDLPKVVYDRMSEELTTVQFAMMKSHYVHMSTSTPGMISYTPTAQHGEGDRQTVTKIGRYLTRALNVENPCVVKSISESFNIANDIADKPDIEVLFATDPDDIAEIYMDGPDSCMSKGMHHWNSHVHPCSSYHPEDWSLAYTKYGDNEIKARAMVTREMQYIRVYSDRSGGINELGGALEAMGYRHTQDAAKGMRLRRLPCGSSFVAPYIDGAEWNIHDDGTDLWIEAPDRGECVGHTQASYDTKGLCGYDNRKICYDCDERSDEDYIRYVGEIDEWICESCIDDHWRYSDYHDSYIREDSAIWVESRDTYFYDHETVEDYNGDMQFREDCEQTHDGDWIHCDDNYRVETTDGKIALEHDTIECADGSIHLIEDCEENDDGEYNLIGQIVSGYDLAELPISDFEAMYFRYTINPLSRRAVSLAEVSHFHRDGFTPFNEMARQATHDENGDPLSSHALFYLVSDNFRRALIVSDEVIKTFPQQPEQMEISE